MKLSPRNIGIVEILASGICFGFLGIFGKWAYAQGLRPGEFLSLRFLLASLTLALGIAVSRPALFRIQPKALLSCAGLGMLGYAVFAGCYFKALEGLSASLTVLLLYLYPVLVTLGARVFFKERPGMMAWIALPLSSLGVGLLVWGDVSVQAYSALWYGVGSAVFYALYILASSRLLTGVAPLTSAFYIQLSAGLVLSALNLKSLSQVFVLLAAGWKPVLGTALIATVAAMTLFLSGLKKLRQAEVSILSTAEPVTAIVAAGLLLGERLITVQYFGGALVLLALVLVSGFKPRLRLQRALKAARTVE